MHILHYSDGLQSLIRDRTRSGYWVKSLTFRSGACKLELLLATELQLENATPTGPTKDKPFALFISDRSPGGRRSRPGRRHRTRLPESYRTRGPDALGLGRRGGSNRLRSRCRHRHGTVATQRGWI